MHVANGRTSRGRTNAVSRAVRFEALDSWRGIAALVVVLFHAQISSHIFGWPLVRAGEAFTDFFFVLSGFVIAHAYMGRIGSSESLARFLFVRLGRLYPLHVFMFGLFLAFEIAKAQFPGLTNPSDPAFSASNAPWTIVTNILLLHSIRFDDVLSWNTPSWSISAEWICYICFGIAVTFCRRRIDACLVAIVVDAPVLVYAFAPAGMATTADMGAVRALYGFAAGALLFRLFGKYIIATHQMKPRERARSMSVRNWTLLEIATAVIAAAVAIDARGTHFAYATPLVFSVLVAVFAVEHGVISRLLRTRIPLFLGSISYSIYMTHLFVQLRLTNLARLSDSVLGTQLITRIGRTSRFGDGIDIGSLFLGDLIMIAMVAVTIAVSFATYRWIERPGIDWSRKVARRLFPGIAAERKRAAVGGPFDTTS